MDVSIILVNYNTKELTNNCIKSIIQQTKGISFEIIVVDNASTDGSKEIFEKTPNITYIYNQTNLGFGNANNIGLTKATGKYIFLLNSDTYLLNNAIYHFWSFAESSKEDIACIGSILYDSKLNINTSEVEFPTFKRILSASLNKFKFFNSKKTPIKKYKDVCFPQEVEAIIGADIFIKRSIITKLGLFDPKIFMYCEEIDLQRRYADHGYKSVLINTPQIVHLEGQSSKKFTAKRNIMFTNGIFYYLRKHNNKFHYLLFRICFLILKLPILFNFHYTLIDRLKIIYNLIKL